MTMIWKETAEFVGNRRSLGVFGFAVLLMGIIPTIATRHMGPGTPETLRVLFDVFYVIFATLIVVANTASDLVLHERVGRTLDYLLATRLPDSAIFLGKVIVSALMGYLAALVAIALQIGVTAALQGHGFSWIYLADPIGRIVALGITACLAVYASVVGTFVALRIGDQRSAYLLTVLSIGVILLPLILGWIPIETTTAWFADAALVFAGIAVALAAIGVLLFKRELLVLNLQE